MHLVFGPRVTTLSSDDGVVVRVPITPAALVAACFQQAQPTSLELERAIDAVEDALTTAPSIKLRDAGLVTFDPSLRRLPGLGVEGATLSRDAVELLFQRLASIASGSPLTGDWVTVDPELAAGLLITREFMHHLGFESLRVARKSSG